MVKNHHQSNEQGRDDTVYLYCCPQSDCFKEYKCRFSLRRHFEMTHLGKTFFACHICKKSLASNQILREHLYKHSGIKPYRCSICRIRFRQYSHLSVHKLKHKQDKLKNKTKQLLTSV